MLPQATGDTKRGQKALLQISDQFSPVNKHLLFINLRDRLLFEMFFSIRGGHFLFCGDGERREALAAEVNASFVG